MDLAHVRTQDLREELKLRDEWPSQIASGGDLAKAIDYARWGNFELAVHYLVKAVPELYPLGRKLGA